MIATIINAVAIVIGGLLGLIIKVDLIKSCKP